MTQVPDERCLWGKGICWQISGAISKDDVRIVASIAQRMAAANPKQRPGFELDSEGGDVEAAISIGRLLRKMSAHAQIRGDAKCFSSCVFIYAGATHRVGEKIGIHRPFSLSTEARTFDEIQAEQRRLNSVVGAFLEEMNVSPRLLEAMNNVSPQNIRMLSDVEMEEFGLVNMDPVLQALQDAESAREYGLSMPEYLRRKVLYEATCLKDFLSPLGPRSFNLDQHWRCKEAIMRGSK